MPPRRNTRDGKLLKLGEYVNDPFLDLFNEEFHKISTVLIAKRKKRIAQKELNEKVALGIVTLDKSKDRRASTKSLGGNISGLGENKAGGSSNADMLA